MRTCPDCHSLVDDTAIFCDNCGFRLPSFNKEIPPTVKADILPSPQPAAEPAAKESAKGACSACGFLNVPGEMFCQNCGVQLAPVTSVPPPPPTPVDEPPAQRPGIKSTSVETPQEMDVECSNCGYQNPAMGKFCLNCGEPLKGLARTAQEQVIRETSLAAAPEESLSEGKGEETAREVLPDVMVEAKPEGASGELEKDIATETASEQEGDLTPSGLAPELQDEVSPQILEPPADEGLKEISEAASVRAEKELVTVEEQVPGLEPAQAEQAGEEMAALPIPGEKKLPQPEVLEIKGKLVVRTSGVEIPLPSAHTEIRIGRVDLVRSIFPDVDLSGYGGETSGVSRIHARLVLDENQLFIEDLNSTNYTFLNKLRLEPGHRYQVKDGDEIRFGLLATNYFST